VIAGGQGCDTVGPSATRGQVRGGAGGGIRCDPATKCGLRRVPWRRRRRLAAVEPAHGARRRGPRATRGQVRGGAGGGIPRDPHGEVGDDAGTEVRRDLLGGAGLALLATPRPSAGRRGRSGHLQFMRPSVQGLGTCLCGSALVVSLRFPVFKCSSIDLLC
jgi:hypothetical protein